ncbi:hypothetical protein NQ314_018140 [Rhamnusium bicolor]|uniref:Uncharacterized protein n=1 Tax=Rhamnusium bicolor TaxID=1586634 RepID=A0AAV8WRY5_9CUCU|nr:hypothetical protein NQ314_018140 [Rhamnusium bicolor]
MFSILGLQVANELNIIDTNEKLGVETISTNSSNFMTVQNILNKHKSIISGLGKVIDNTYKIILIENAVPRISTACDLIVYQIIKVGYKTFKIPVYTRVYPLKTNRYFKS